MVIGVSGTKISPNLSYALSAYVKGTAGATITPTVVWKNSSGTIVQTDTGTATTLTTSFQRISLLPSANIGVATASINSNYLGVTLPSTPIVGQSISAIGLVSGTVISGVSALGGNAFLLTLSTSASIADGTVVTINQMTSPATAAVAEVTFTFSGTIGDIYYVDSLLFELAASALPYFDGGTGYRMTDDLLWESNSNVNGRGLYYKNRSAAIDRLNTELTEYIPMGATFALITGRSSIS
jgi:hypothetical protein